MPRRKLIREYAIRLVHPIIGEYYFSYNNLDYYTGKSNFMFTQELPKVSKRKNITTIENQISEIMENLKQQSGRILIPFGRELKKELPEEIKAKIFCHRNRYYYPIDAIISKHHIEKARTVLNETTGLVNSDAQKIIEMVTKSMHFSKDFTKIVRRLEDNANICRKNHEFLEKNKNISDFINLDIVDASFGFRYLKLKTLKEINNEETEDITT